MCVGGGGRPASVSPYDHALASADQAWWTRQCPAAPLISTLPLTPLHPPQTIRDLQVTLLKSKVIHTDEGTGATTLYQEVQIEDGLTWDDAVQRQVEVHDEMKEAGISDARITKACGNAGGGGEEGDK